MTYPGYPGGDPQDPNQQPHQQQFGGPMPPYAQQSLKPVGDPGTLDLPWYGIGFGQAISRAFKKYVRFDGRASRSEFWWFYLFSVIVSFVLSLPSEIQQITQTISETANGTTPPVTYFHPLMIPAYIWSLVVLLPTLGLFWRRLHDTNRSGAWWFFVFLCGIGGIIPLILCILDTKPEGRRYDRVRTGGGYGPGGYPPNAG